MVDDAIRFVSNHNNPVLAIGKNRDGGSTEEQRDAEELVEWIDTSGFEENIDRQTTTTSTTNQTF